MRTFDFTPYYRSTVGFDRLFDLLDQSIRSDWPPYEPSFLSFFRIRCALTSGQEMWQSSRRVRAINVSKRATIFLSSGLTRHRAPMTNARH
jgi:hypothetical protein